MRTLENISKEETMVELPGSYSQLIHIQEPPNQITTTTVPQVTYLE